MTASSALLIRARKEEESNITTLQYLVKKRSRIIQKTDEKCPCFKMQHGRYNHYRGRNKGMYSRHVNHPKESLWGREIVVFDSCTVGVSVRSLGQMRDGGTWISTDGRTDGRGTRPGRSGKERYFPSRSNLPALSKRSSLCGKVSYGFPFHKFGSGREFCTCSCCCTMYTCQDAKGKILVLRKRLP